MLANLDGEALADPRPVRFTPGRRLKAWDKNVVAIGPVVRLPRAAGIDQHPFDPDRHHPSCWRCSRRPGFSAPDMDEYNRQAQFEYRGRPRLHHRALQGHRRTGDPFWDHVRTMDVPDSLTSGFELFRSSGRFFKHGAAELFAEESWVQVLLGQGFEAKPIRSSQFVPVEEIVGFLNDIADVIADVADAHAGSWRVRVHALPAPSAQHTTAPTRRSCTIWSDSAPLACRRPALVS